MKSYVRCAQRHPSRFYRDESPLLSRRRTLQLLGSASASFAAGPLSACEERNAALPTSSYRLEDRQRLTIPPLYSGAQRNGERVFDLNVQRGKTSFFDGLSTSTIGVNQSYLGPTLEMRRGDRVRMNVRNNMEEITTVHWHGFQLPAGADGGPHQPIRPGQTWSPSFVVRQRASLFWYHSHAHRRSGPQVYAGLAGAIYVRDDEEDSLNLPSDYGVDDVPLIVQDRSFADDGDFIYSTSMHNRMMGMRGDTLLVNGAYDPVFEAASDLLRLRLLNGSNARFYEFAFEDGRAFDLIGSDGGLMQNPHRTNRIVLAPGERVQLIVDFADGRPTELRAESVGNMGMMGGGRMMDSGRMGRRGGRDADMATGRNFRVLTIAPGASRRKAAPLSDRLVDLPFPDRSIAVRQRRFILNMGMGMMGGFTINGRSMDMQRIDERVPVNDWEIWQIENPSMMAHPFHIHDTQFRILDRNGRSPAPAEQGLKDTVIVNPGETVRVLLRFEDYTDPDMPYMYHCHILEHEDAGMMGQFVVTK